MMHHPRQRPGKTVLLTFALAALTCVTMTSAQEPDFGDVGFEFPPEPPPQAADTPTEFDGVPLSIPGGATEALLFYLFGGTLLVSALGVCISRSVVRMATWLFFTLGAASVLYFLLGAAFLGAIQLIVYAGGTLILLVFGVMLTSKSPWVRYDCPRTEMAAAAGVAIVLFAGLLTLLTRTVWPGTAPMARGGTVAEFGKELLTTYLVPFEVASVLLLVVMIAAAYLARQDR